MLLYATLLVDVVNGWYFARLGVPETLLFATFMSDVTNGWQLCKEDAKAAFETYEAQTLLVTKTEVWGVT